MPVDGFTSMSHLASLSKQVLGIETAAKRLAESRDKFVVKSLGAESFVDKLAFKSKEPSFMQTVTQETRGE